MFNKNFFPTPSDVINKMIVAAGGSKALEGKTILEPSAGKGDILQAVKSRIGNYRTPKLICMEIEPDLRAILLNKGFIVIGSDFLVEPMQYDVDFIIMNPPFDNGAAHLLRAWEVLRKGKIICLLNAETLNNPYSEQRKHLALLIEKYGQKTELGKCFKGAERSSNVDVIMVVMEKTSENSFDFDQSGFERKNMDIPEDLNKCTQLELIDPLLNRENRYNVAVEHLRIAMENLAAFREIAAPLVVHLSDYKNQLADGKYNDILQDFNNNCWQSILNLSKFQNYMTEKVQKDFLSKFNLQKNIAFTKNNMLEMFDILMQNKASILDNCILEVFDAMTKYYFENREYLEGWKTNDAYKVNMKVILPNTIEIGFNQKFRVVYKYENSLNDIDRALCYLTGTKLDSIVSIVKALTGAFDAIGHKITNNTKECESTFFKIRFFKKGTIHLTFKDKFVWQWFNCKASELRGYPLPEAKEVYSKAKQIKVL